MFCFDAAHCCRATDFDNAMMLMPPLMPPLRFFYAAAATLTPFFAAVLISLIRFSPSDYASRYAGRDMLLTLLLPCRCCRFCRILRADDAAAATFAATLSAPPP